MNAHFHDWPDARRYAFLVDHGHYQRPDDRCVDFLDRDGVHRDEHGMLVGIVGHLRPGMLCVPGRLLVMVRGKAMPMFMCMVGDVNVQLGRVEAGREKGSSSE